MIDPKHTPNQQDGAATGEAVPTPSQQSVRGAIQPKQADRVADIEVKVTKDGRYRATCDGIQIARYTKDGVEYDPLTTFRATIIEQIVRDDDGVEVVQAFVIEARVGDVTHRFRISAAEFSQMRWPIQYLGAAAVVHAGIINAQRAAEAIQLLSGEVPTVLEITHTGWRKFDGQWIFLHSGSQFGRVEVSEKALPNQNSTADPTADGASNPRHEQDIQEAGRVGRAVTARVALDGGLELIYLPPVGGEQEIGKLFREVLKLLDLAPIEVIAPLFCAPWTAALYSPADFAIHVSGPSGCFKSELTAIFQSFFGPNLTSRNFLGSWSSTGNSLEALLYDAKDILVVIDDYAPQGVMSDAKLHAAAEQVFRAQGNGAGRGRARPDGSRRPVKRPRGLLISSGEDVPCGYSLQARLTNIFVDKGSISIEKLTNAQEQARLGTYARVMNAFTDFYAPKIECMKSSLTDEMAEHRKCFNDPRSHSRQPDIIARLLAGLDAFLAFAEKLNAVSKSEAERLWFQISEGLKKTAQKQRHDLWSSDPVARFRELLRSALTSGIGHLCSQVGREPDNPRAMGWKWYGGSEDEDKGSYRSSGECFGWECGSDIYLDPVSSLRVAKRAIGSGGEPLTVTLRILKKRLMPYLKSTDLDQRETYTIRKTFQGARRDVLHLDLEFLVERAFSEEESDQDFSELLKY